MTDYAQEVTAILAADAELQGLLPGGIYNYPDAGRKGTNRLQLPKAFDTVSGLLKPCCTVLQLSETPTWEAVHMPTGYMSTVTPIMVWVYAAGDADQYGNSPYALIKAACDRIYTLLHGTPIPGAFQALYQNLVLDKREPDLKDAAYERIDFNVYGFREKA